MKLRSSAVIAALGVITILAAGCNATGSAFTPRADSSASATSLRLGYQPNVTHSPAIAGVEEGYFREALGTTHFDSKAFGAGPAAIEGILSGGLDAAYVGPNPAINAYIRSRGQAVRIVAGATSGGASLVVNPSISGAQDLRGRRLASPQLGGTQDVALRTWLATNGLTTNVRGGGDVSIQPQENSQTFETFRTGRIDGAWVPEPWATRMVTEAGGRVLVNEASLWPEGEFATTMLLVSTRYLNSYPATVRKMLEAHVRSIAFVTSQTNAAQAAVNAGIRRATSRALPPEIVADAWSEMTFTVDPIATSLTKDAADAKALGFIDSDDVSGIYDLSILNAALADAGQSPVAQT